MCIFIILTIEIGTFEPKLFLGNFLQLWRGARAGAQRAVVQHFMIWAGLRVPAEMIFLWFIGVRFAIVRWFIEQFRKQTSVQVKQPGLSVSVSLRESGARDSVTVTRYELLECLCSQGVIKGMIRDRVVREDKTVNTHHKHLPHHLLSSRHHHYSCEKQL